MVMSSGETGRWVRVNTARQALKHRLGLNQPAKYLINVTGAEQITVNPISVSGVLFVKRLQENRI